MASGQMPPLLLSRSASWDPDPSPLPRCVGSGMERLHLVAVWQYYATSTEKEFVCSACHASLVFPLLSGSLFITLITYSLPVLTHGI